MDASRSEALASSLSAFGRRRARAIQSDDRARGCRHTTADVFTRFQGASTIALDGERNLNER